MFAFHLQVCPPPTPSVLPEAGLGGVGDDQKDPEAEQSQEGKDVGASQRRAVQQLWRERWPVQQLHRLQLMQLTVTVFQKVSERNPALSGTRSASVVVCVCTCCTEAQYSPSLPPQQASQRASLPWAGLVPPPPSTPAEAPPPRPKEAPLPRAPTNSWPTATPIAAQSGRARALVVLGLDDALATLYKHDCLTIEHRLTTDLLPL